MHKILWGDHISIKLLRDVDADLLSKHYDTTPQGDVLLLLDETSDIDKHASNRSSETDVSFPLDESNLIAKTLDKARRGNESYLVLTRKRIPAGTGLGGGTADGAYVLKSLGSMLPPEESLSIGSDFAFLQSSDSIALVSGRGDKVTPLPPLNYTMPLYILIPDEVCNTAEIFKRARELMQQGRMEYRTYSMERAIIELAQFDKYRPHNSLESCIDNEVVKSLLSTLADNLGQHQYGMSGSGSACFAIGVDDIDVLRVREVFGRPLKIVKTRLMQPGDTPCEFSYL
uniref:Uncharacterized protein n=1 Tax=Babesia bovis TaxID=5865 RepID=S6BF85_BABBO|nr:hypothetical protein [Babesia bovis]